MSTDVEPDCRYAALLGERNGWEEREVTDKLLTWHDPCMRCFPDGRIDVHTVVRKRSRGSQSQRLHRPAED